MEIEFTGGGVVDDPSAITTVRFRATDASGNVGTCETQLHVSDADECADGTHTCHESAVCENLFDMRGDPGTVSDHVVTGTYACTCPQGLVGDGYSGCTSHWGLAMNLDTNDGGIQHWDSAWWTSADTTTDDISTLPTSGDQKTPRWLQPIGSKFRIVAHQAGVPLNEAIYDVLTEHQGSSLYELFSGGSNIDLTEAKSSPTESDQYTPATGADWQGIVTNSFNGAGWDLFMDRNDAVRLNCHTLVANSGGGTNRARIGTNANWIGTGDQLGCCPGSCHNFGGVGLYHHCNGHGGWSTNTDVSPATGYCGMNTKYGTDQTYANENIEGCSSSNAVPIDYAFFTM
jgi:hypothetical protein